MPNVLMIKVANDHFMSSFKTKQDYSGAAAIADGMMARHHGGAAYVGIALCDCEAMASAINDDGKFYEAGPAGGSDFDIKQKSTLTTETAIPPEGLTLGDLADTDWVVCYV